MGKSIADVIEEEGFYMATISGDSMMPMLVQGKDLVKIVKADDILKKGDVPLYRRPRGEYVLHRILAVKKGYYIICGDNRTNKEKVPFQWVIGVMEEFEHNGCRIACDNSNYRDYVKKIQRGFYTRKIKRKINRIKKKISDWIK